uniref:Uncharacterized protein n=1 Tax=Panagrolaimus sp. ES5 TaxID=591445 RepID=A0AC34G303_9BILA
MISYADTFSVNYNQTHTLNDLTFDEKQMSVKGYPYRFGVANKIDGKTFYRCLECRNLKNKIKDASSSSNEIVGTLVFHTKEKLLKGDVNAPGGYRHLCNNPIFRPLPPCSNNDIAGSMTTRILIESTFYQFDKLFLKIANQQHQFKHIGCSEGVRYYACLPCIGQKKYRYDMDNFLIFNVYQKSLYSNVGGLASLKHVCSDTSVNKIRTQISENIDDIYENDAEVSDFGEDFEDTVSVSDSASNVGTKRPYSQDLPPLNDHNFDYIDSVMLIDEIRESAPPSPQSFDIQPPPKRRSFSSYFNFSFIPSRSTESIVQTVPKVQHHSTAASAHINDQQEMDSDGKVLMASTILRRVYVRQTTTGEKLVFPHADIPLPIEDIPEAAQCCDIRNLLRNCPKPRIVIFADTLLTLLDPDSLNSNVLLIRIEKMAYIGSALNEFLTYMDQDFNVQECLFLIVAGYDMVRCFRNLPVLSTASQLHKDIVDFATKIIPCKVVFVTTPEIGVLKSTLQLLNLLMLQALTLQNNSNIHVYNFAEEVNKSSFANTSVYTRTLFLLKSIGDSFGCSLLK